MQSVKEEGRPVKSESENIYGTLLLWGGLWRMFCYIYYIYIVPVASRSFLTGSQKKEQSPLCPFLCKVSDPSLGIYIYIHSMVLKTTPCLLAWDPPDWKWLSCRNLGSNYCYFSGSQQSWRKSSHDMFHNPEFWLSSQVIHRILSHQQTILALVLQAW